MSHESPYRWTGLCGLAAIAIFLIEFPIYFLRGPLPSLTADDLSAYSTRNAVNMLLVVLMDLLIYGIFLIFLAGFRRVICESSRDCEWMGTLVLGIGLVYTTITLVADSLQGTIALDALTGTPNATVIRTLMEAQYLLFGSMGLFLIALLLAAGSYASVASGALPEWSAWLGYAGAFLSLAFVPSMFAGAPNLSVFYNPAGWGTTGVIAGFPLAAWMIAVSILLMKKRRRISN